MSPVLSGELIIRENFSEHRNLVLKQCPTTHNKEPCLTWKQKEEKKAFKSKQLV